jgi:hypothetical protein
VEIFNGEVLPATTCATLRAAFAKSAAARMDHNNQSREFLKNNLSPNLLFFRFPSIGDVGDAERNHGC